MTDIYSIIGLAAAQAGVVLASAWKLSAKLTSLSERVGEVLMQCNGNCLVHQVQRTIANGSTIKVRGQCSGVPDAGYSAIVYAVSGDG